MTDDEPLLTCGSCGCEITDAEDRDNAGLCDDCEMDFEFDDPDDEFDDPDDDFDDDIDDDIDDDMEECDVCGTSMMAGEHWSLGGLCDECWDAEEDDDE